MQHHCLRHEKYSGIYSSQAHLRLKLIKQYFNTRISGRSRISHWRGRPLTQVLFSKTMCENERIGSHGGGGGVLAAPLVSAIKNYEVLCNIMRIAECDKSYVSANHFSVITRFSSFSKVLSCQIGLTSMRNPENHLNLNYFCRLTLALTHSGG